MPKIIIGKVNLREGNNDCCYCDHTEGYFHINNNDVVEQLKSSTLIKYLAFDNKPPELDEIIDGEYFINNEEFKTIGNFMTLNVLQNLYVHTEEQTYTGRCYSEWTCGEGDVTLEAVRFNEVNALNNKYIILYIK